MKKLLTILLLTLLFAGCMVRHHDTIENRIVTTITKGEDGCWYTLKADPFTWIKWKLPCGCLEVGDTVVLTPQNLWKAQK
ncbi:MAG: hypothetical protein ACYS30_19660 [Planctomycetota bacterium]|jgi:hypothetical protein